MNQARKNRLFSPVLLLLLILLTGCAYYQDLYYQRLTDEAVTIGPYTLSPRMFGFKDELADSTKLVDESLVISVRVAAGDAERDIEEWSQTQDQVDSAATQFLKAVTETFVPDSLVLHLLGAHLFPVVLHHDPNNFSPRRDNFLTLQFGREELPPEARLVRAVLHVTRPEGPDSAVWLMGRQDATEKGFTALRTPAVGY